jgi:phage N-6-adenine-methyltransferase
MDLETQGEGALMAHCQSRIDLTAAPISASAPPVDEMQLRQEWRTPPKFLAALSREFAIGVDVASSDDNAVARNHLTREMDGLSRSWFRLEDAGHVVHYPRVAWCNPGFKDLGAWVAKAIQEVDANPGCVALIMGTAAPSTIWWARALAAGAEIRLLAPRVQFVAPPGIKQSSNARENALVIIRSQVGGAAIMRERRAHIWTWRWDAEAALTNSEES